MEFLMQPVGRSALLEGVGESLVTPPEWRCGGGASAAGAASGGREQRSTDLGGGRCCSGQKGKLPSNVRAVDGEDEFQAPGWNKRLRIGAAAPSRTPCPN